MTATAANPEVPSTPWWLVLLEGIAAVIVGIMLLSNTAETTVFLIQVLGLYWLISGILSIIRIFMDSSGWGWKLLSGVIGIMAGVLVLQNPLWSAILVPTTLVWMIGLGGIVMGIISLIQAFRGGGWGAGILGVLSIIFGIMLVGNAFIAALGLPWLIAIFALVGGIAAIIQAFRMR